MANMIGEASARLYEIETQRIFAAARAAGALAGEHLPREDWPAATEAAVTQIITNHPASVEQYGLAG
ncbi:MAG TPA: hypothetical protein VL737_04895 [Candidatus Pristimantibacillus sp.]|jgi:hypothetical protein|nr:hypothetical protein [Candidatus Pristimantibacillus sp.]